MKNIVKLASIIIIALFFIGNSITAQDAPEKAEKAEKKCKMEKTEGMKDCCKDKEGKKDDECKMEDKKDCPKMKEHGDMKGHDKMMKEHGKEMDHSKMEGMDHDKMMKEHGKMESNGKEMDHSKMMGMGHDKMEKEHKKMGDSIVREGAIDVASIDKNGDGKVFQDMMDWNVISDEAGECPLCGMKLKEVSIDDAKKNLEKNGFKVK
ncbi:MAG: hypothetical protein L3J41_01260 [Melioribacteraceae bacterium]|nr:hypothetical protein [Melioribacteraceae bacterium]